MNATKVGEDAEKWDAVVDVFVRVAEDLGAFFGAGYITRGVLVGKRGASWYGRETENFAFDWIAGPWWTGLPAKPTWLTWYGTPYRDIVRPFIEGQAITHDHGLLVRLGPAPMDSDEARPIAPALPTDAVITMTPRYGKGPMSWAGNRSIRFYDRKPAAVMPPLD